MLSILLLGFSTAFLQLTTVELTVITIPPDSRVDIPLSPTAGEVEARRRLNQTTLEVRLDSVAPLAALGEAMRAYVVWAVSPEGEFENLGELELDGREAELDTATAFQRFGLLITAEPYFSVTAPAAAVAFTSAPPRDEDVRIESLQVEVGLYDYSTANLRPQGSISPRVTQARMAFRIAELEGADQLAEAEFRQARVAFDSMEELLRRQLDAEVLEAYVNDAIRLAARAIRVGREQQFQLLLDTVTRRAESAERDSERLQVEVERLDQRQQEASVRLTEVQSELQAARDENRQLGLTRDEVERQLRTAESDIETLSDPWPQLLRALTSAGARETADGAQVMLTADRFEAGAAEFSDGTRELLARLVGIVRSGVVPRIRIAAHVSDSGPASESLTLSEERAQAVSDYLLGAGVPEEQLRAEGYGFSRPVPGLADRSDPAHERVEITISEP